MSAFIGPALLKRLVAEKADVPEDLVGIIVDAFNECVLHCLEHGARVRILGVGYLEIKARKASRRRSPMLGGRYVKVPAKKKIVFRETRKK